MLLVAGVVLSPLAHAQFLNVSLYGNLNLDVEVVNGTQIDGSNPSIVRVSSNSSRFGLRGHEYLGRGQVAIFQLESTILGDTGGSALASRETYVGLQGDWGTMKLGSFLTPYDDILTIFGNTPTLTTSILSTAALWAQGALTKNEGGFDARLGNSIRYETPPLQGFSAALQFATRDTSGDPNGGDNGDRLSELRHANVISGGAFYNRGPLDLGIAYERNYRIRPTGPTDDALSLTGGYDFGTIASNVGLRLAGVYERLKYDTPTGSLDARLLRSVDDAGGRGRHLLRLLGQGRRREGQPLSTAQRSERWSKARIRRASNGSCHTATTCRCERCSTLDGCK